VYTWGYGANGRLGHGDQIDQYTPKRIEALIGVKAKQVACGYRHTAVCTEDGEVFTFGSGYYGKLGHGDKEDKTSPALVKALQGKHITHVQCGLSHTMALTSSGYVFTWGNRENGRLGHGKSSELGLSIPCLVEGLRDHNVVQITSSGEKHCAALVDPSPFSIRQSQQAACNNKENSDVVFMVENEPLYANVDVISQKSDYFNAMFRSNMRESIERVVQVPNCSKAAFVQVLEYLCLDDFVISLDHVLELWHLADMYELEGLKFYCMSALERGLFCRENVHQILQEAENLNCPCDELKRMCREYLSTR
jgi:alpha-tubulin suppressor-like RCC1 family protein